MSLYTTLKNTILDIIFPMACVGCGQSKTFLCETCLVHIPIHTAHICPICTKKNTPYGEVCFECLGQSPLDGILVASHYHHPVLTKAIHLYKYRFIQSLHLPLGQLLLSSIIQSNIPLPNMLCPVPLHPWRLRWRGFNQSQLLAQTLSTQLIPHMDIPLLTGLTRGRFTAPQMSIQNADERIHNISGAFIWKPSSTLHENIQGKYIWLIDDVATTGTTLQECAKILKQNGAKKVFGVVLGR